MCQSNWKYLGQQTYEEKTPDFFEGPKFLASDIIIVCLP
jgi:hypothetical protein